MALEELDLQALLPHLGKSRVDVVPLAEAEARDGLEAESGRGRILELVSGCGKRTRERAQAIDEL